MAGILLNFRTEIGQQGWIRQKTSCNVCKITEFVETIHLDDKVTVLKRHNQE
ncbi:hypothetical protein GGE09_004611 [Roseobacter sp. N2S]|nr:hypothetical protein [Roseobacter sp. N2S]